MILLVPRTSELDEIRAITDCTEHFELKWKSAKLLYQKLSSFWKCEPIDNWSSVGSPQPIISLQNETRFPPLLDCFGSIVSVISGKPFSSFTNFTSSQVAEIDIETFLSQTNEISHRSTGT
jgi:hypothetical protein